MRETGTVLTRYSGQPAVGGGGGGKGGLDGTVMRLLSLWVTPQPVLTLAGREVKLILKSSRAIWKSMRLGTTWKPT